MSERERSQLYILGLVRYIPALYKVHDQSLHEALIKYPYFEWRFLWGVWEFEVVFFSPNFQVYALFAWIVVNVFPLHVLRWKA